MNTKTHAALSHVISSCFAPNQLQFHDHIVIAHGAECTGIMLSIKYQGNYKSRHSSSPNTALEFGAFITHIRAGSGHLVVEIGFKS